MAQNLKKTLREVKVTLSKTRSIIIVPPEYPTLDNAVATKMLLELFTGELNKPTKVLVPEDYKLPSRIADLVGYSEIPEEHRIHKIDPLSYKITVPGVDENTEVEWKIENNTFEVVLKPKEGKVDLTKTEFDTEGQRYDLIVTVGAQNEAMLTSAYHDSQEAVEQMLKVNLDVHPKNTEYAKINALSETLSTVTEIVCGLYKTLGAKLSKESAEMAMKTIVIATDGLRRVASSKSLTNIVVLEEKAEADVKDLLKSHYLSLGTKGLTLRKEMLDRIKTGNGSGIVTSVLPKSVMDQLGISTDVLDGVEQLPFNITKDTKVAALVYQVSDTTWKTLALANDPSTDLHAWAKANNGKGVSDVAMAEFEGDEATVSQKVVDTLKGGAPAEKPEEPEVTEEPQQEAQEEQAEPEEKAEKKTSDEPPVAKTTEAIVPPAPTATTTNTPFKKAADNEVEKVASQGTNSSRSALPGSKTAQSPFKKAQALG